MGQFSPQSVVKTVKNTLGHAKMPSPGHGEGNFTMFHRGDIFVQTAATVDSLHPAAASAAGFNRPL